MSARALMHGVRMQSREGLTKAGAFTLANGTTLRGELSLSGPTTRIELHSDAPIHLDSKSDMFAVFDDKSKASMVNCATVSTGSGAGLEQARYYAKVFPHFVIFGDEYLASLDTKISRVSLSIDDASTIFHDNDSFGMVIDAKPLVEHVLKQANSTRECGDYPEVFYYDGNHEVLSVETTIGRVAVWNQVSFTYPGPTGIRLDNTIMLSVEFHDGHTIKGASLKTLALLRFLQAVAGRPQNLLKLTFSTTRDFSRPDDLDVYWCMPPRRSTDFEPARAHPADLPLRAAWEPGEFTGVLAQWLKREDEWHSARARHSAVSSERNRYGIDRIVGAANVFDILPSSAFPASVELSEDLEVAKEKARSAFKHLPPSPERDSVLGALGRLGRANLKRKVRFRANLITDTIGDRLPDLDVAVDEAVNCRNYYVHGSERQIDYDTHPGQVEFLTDTLEFVFSASDLVDCGWDIKRWASRGSTLSHPFAQYCLTYQRRLNELRVLLGLS